MCLNPWNPNNVLGLILLGHFPVLQQCDLVALFGGITPYLNHSKMVPEIWWLWKLAQNYFPIAFSQRVELYILYILCIIISRESTLEVSSALCF